MSRGEMMTAPRRLRRAAGLSLLVAALVLNVGTALAHPGTTTTQLFLNFWWLWLAGLVVAAVGFVLVDPGS